MPIRIVADLIERGNRPIPVMLIELANKLKDWRGFWATVFIPRYLSQVQQNFQTEGELSSRSGWPDLNPEYAAWKARHFPGTKILERTRRLRDSLAPGATGPDTVIEAGPLNMRIGTNVPWGKYHVQERPFLVRVSMKEWAPFVRTWMKEQATAAGLQ